MTEKILNQYKVLVDMLNQIFEIERKISKISQSHTIQRNLATLKNIFAQRLLEDEQASLEYYSPMGEPYDITRTDCEASIAGNSPDNLVVVEVIKPIIYYKQQGVAQIIQRAVVVVQDKNTIAPTIQENASSAADVIQEQSTQKIDIHIYFSVLQSLGFSKHKIKKLLYKQGKMN